MGCGSSTAVVPLGPPSVYEYGFTPAFMEQVRKMGVTDGQLATLKRKFDEIDDDGNRFINQEELKIWLKKKGLNTDVAKLIEKYDKNNDGVITFEEFCKFQIQRLGSTFSLVPEKKF